VNESAADLPAAAVVVIRLGVLALLIAIWELLPRAGWVDPELLPPFSVVAASVPQLLARAEIRDSLGLTGLEFAVAFVLAVPIGAAIGIATAESRYLGQVLDPLFFFLFGIPKSIFLPIFILTLGIGFWQKVGFGVFSTFLIILLSTAAAVRSVKPEHVTVARSYGATRAQILARVYLPSVLPILVEALRIGVIFTLTAVLLAEMYASRSGIGHDIETWGENFQMRQLLAGVLILSVAAITMNETIRWIEGRFGTWRS
jgi:NitT/TauT family transport system permease protein